MPGWRGPAVAGMAHACARPLDSCLLRGIVDVGQCVLDELAQRCVLRLDVVICDNEALSWYVDSVLAG